MKFITNRASLLKVLQKVQRAVSVKASLPVLEGILFEVQGDCLTTTATNLDISIQCTAKINGFRDGSVVLPSRYITEIVRRLPETEIEVESNDLNITLYYYVNSSDTGSKTVIQGLDPKSYPSFPDAEKLKTLLIIKSEALEEALKRVLFAVSKEESRPVFTGVLFQTQASHQQHDTLQCHSDLDKESAFLSLNLVATDTHRLVYRKIKGPGTENLLRAGSGYVDTDILVPGKNLNELTRIIAQSGTGEEVEISLGDNQIFFVNDTTILVSRLIAGQFPLYQQVIPQKFILSVCLNTRELQAAVERSMLFMQEDVPLVNLSFQKGKCVVSTQSQAGKIKENLTLNTLSPVSSNECYLDQQDSGGDDSFYENFSDQTCRIYFNTHYLVEALKFMPTEEVMFNITGPLSAMVMHPVVRSGDKYSIEDSYLSLLLPACYEEG